MPRTRAMTAAQVIEHDNKSGSQSLKSNPSKPLPRKRARTNKEVTRASKRGGKPSLRRILDMSPEIFNEVAGHLTPGDLLSLARSNKFFRKMFMSRSSRHRWQTAFNNIPDIPPCPSDLCEPQYASLLFSKTCSKCGAGVQRLMDPFLHVRLCNLCRVQDLVEISRFSSVYRLVSRSTVRKRGSTSVFTLRSELEGVKHGAQDQGKFPEWCKARLEEVKARHERDELLEAYLQKVEHDRELELEHLKDERNAEIEARLLENGWTQRDMFPSPENSAEWNKLTWQPKLITDRTWANLYPKLVPLLKSNRTYNEGLDKETRRLDRIERVEELVTKIKKALPPLVHVTLQRPVENGDTLGPSESTSGGHSGSGNNSIDVKVDAPFPWMAELLAWPMIKRIVENDTSPEDAETSFNKIREEFDAAVVDWRDKVEQDLVDIWGAGRAEDHGNEAKSGSSTSNGKGKAAARTGAGRSTRKTKGREPVVKLSASEASHDPIELVLPEFTVTFTKPDGTTTTNLSELSSNLQILLRADTMFKAGPYHSYPGVISPGDPSRQMAGVSTYEAELYGGRWSAEDIKRDDEASTLARALLAKMGRSGATTAEMQAIRANLRCGRCIQTLPGTWESLVLRYRREQTNWKQAQDKIYENPKSDFVYHNIHDLGPGNSRPFAHYMTPEAAADYALENTTHEPYIMTCIPCERMGIIANHLHSFNEGAETPMVQHLRDVHDIAEAVFGLHFQRWAFDLDFVDPFDDEDEDESEDGDEGEDEYWVW